MPEIRRLQPGAGSESCGTNRRAQAQQFYAAAVLLLLVVGGCTSRDSTPDNAFSTRDSAGVTIAENHRSGAPAVCSLSPAPEVTIGVVEGPEEYQLYRVFDATRLSNGELAVVNQGSEEVRVFDQEGVFLRALGGRGEGPGEFRNVFQIWSLPGDTLWVGDYRPWRFLLFSPTGEWVRTIQPSPMYVNSPREMGLLDSGRAVLGSPVRVPEGPGFKLEYLHLVLHAPDGALTDSLGVFPHGHWGKTTDTPNAMRLYPFFESFTRVAVGTDRFAVSTALEPEIRIFDPDGKLVRLVRWEAGDRTVKGSDVDAEKARLSGQYPDMDAATRRMMVEPLIHEDRPAADRFPALAGLRYGTDDILWVREYPRPTDIGPNRWLSFDPDGRLLCQAEIPKGLDIYELGPGYLLGKEEDDLGVERVVLYGLTPGVP